MIQYILQRSNICLADLALSILEAHISTLLYQPKNHVTLAYLELEQLSGSRALKVLDIRLDDRTRIEIHQGAEVNPTQRQTTHSLFAPPLCDRVGRKR